MQVKFKSEVAAACTCGNEKFTSDSALITCWGGFPQIVRILKCTHCGLEHILKMGAMVLLEKAGG